MRANHKGEVYVWGTLIPKEIIFKSPTFLELKEKAIDVSVGSSHVLVLTESNDVYSMGRGDKGALGYVLKDKELPPTTTKLTKIEFDPLEDVSTNTTVAPTSPKVPKGNQKRALGKSIEDNKINVKSISCGTHSGSALTTEGLVYNWGRIASFESRNIIGTPKVRMKSILATFYVKTGVD